MAKRVLLERDKVSICRLYEATCSVESSTPTPAGPTTRCRGHVSCRPSRTFRTMCPTESPSYATYRGASTAMATDACDASVHYDLVACTL